VKPPVAIRLRGVTQSFGGAPVIEHLDLEIAPGQTTALIGPSGCGKSTILRLILGLLEPNTGTVEVAGAPVTRDRTEPLRRRSGYVIQDGGLFPHLTAQENVTLLARHLGRAAAWITDRLTALCDLTRLAPEQLTRYPVELSGGQRQRVSLMRALMLEPELLLLDEPLGALDPLVRAGLQTDLRGIFRQLGQTIVLVTHDLAEAAYLADHIVLLEAGRVAQEGTFQELRDSPATPFVRDFLQAQRPLATW
jgi:osmoprotectant transport system ATP-binding protein